MKSLSCNTKALTVKLPHCPTNWFNTVIRCANTHLLNCRHTNQVCKPYKKQQVSSLVFKHNGKSERKSRMRNQQRKMKRNAGGRGRQEGSQRGPNLTNEIHTTLVDHVVNHGLTLREAGLRVQPNLSRYTVASVIRTFRLENRIEGRERQGGRPPKFTEQQEREIVNMVLANNATTLNQLQADIVNNHVIFNNVHQISTSTLARILKKNHIQMKQIYRVPFERNSERVKRLRHDYAEIYTELHNCA
ncbi:uncharacterized protein LOC114473168 isoform X2 [Gouania willdenowi]|uniref:uncharacterized protein LOC114473168 isoform X2 n=1 Tax=Gouania willdenowi TaxID=441366 RepID=UPI001055B76F|nr:uncharacterized protein LOC114473168 isoform X2 [Gouania willdenowi]